MAGGPKSFKLNVLGRVASPDPLITLAEFGARRAIERVNFPADWVEGLTKQITDLRSFIEGLSGSYKATALENLGECLFDLIIQGEVRDLLLRASGAANGTLPFELLVEDEVILSWPWEYMFDRSQERYICQDFNPISRTVVTPEALITDLAPLSTLRVLVVVAATDKRTGPEEQVRAIRYAFETYLGAEHERVVLDVHGNMDPDELRAYLNTAAFNVIHFFGHAGVDSRGGFLAFEKVNGANVDRFEKRAKFFARMLTSQPTRPRLVFLNACETAIGSESEDTARNSVAIELMRYGLPAVIATQFKMPANRSHRFAALVYSAIANGRPLIQAMLDGRSAMDDAGSDRFVDWGIPVLYATDPHLVLLREPRMQGKAKKEEKRKGASLPGLLQSVGGAIVGGVDALANRLSAKVQRVTLLDADADVGVLPDLIASANTVQNYFQFSVAPYDLVPGDVVEGKDVLTEVAEGTVGQVAAHLAPDGHVTGPQLYVPRIATRLAQAPARYRADYVLCLTRHRVSTIDYDGTILPDLFITLVDTEDLVGTLAEYRVAVISTASLRDFAATAEVSMAKGTLFLCIAALLDLANDELEFHAETAGCPLDACDVPSDITQSLKKMHFDHKECTGKVSDKAQIDAINALLALPDAYSVDALAATDKWANDDLDRGLPSPGEVVLNGVSLEMGSYATPLLSVQQLGEAGKRPGLPDGVVDELHRGNGKAGTVFLDVRPGIDATKLEEAGWGIVFASDADPEAVLRELEPLIELRKQQCGGAPVFHIFRDQASVARGDSKLEWLQRNGAGPGHVEPRNVPYYLLLIGSPTEISFDFQFQLSVQYAVGRLWFDDIACYGNYARAAVRAAVEKATNRRAVFFGPRNPGDLATRLSATQLVAPLADAFSAAQKTWDVQVHLGEDATKARLLGLINAPSPPAVLFSASHGVSCRTGSAAQREQQGALVCQEWSPLDPVHPLPKDFFASGEDLLETSRLTGSIVFQFACYSGGTPKYDELPTVLGRPAVTVAPEPFLSRLPQRMLGLKDAALAVVAHVDRAYGCSFIWPGVGDYRVPFEDALAFLAKGWPLGEALRGFPARYADLAATLGSGASSKEPDDKVAGWWTAWKDAKNYVILGDPAARLSLPPEDKPNNAVGMVKQPKQ